jgi:hypothetical protein
MTVAHRTTSAHAGVATPRHGSWLARHWNIVVRGLQVASASSVLLAIALHPRFVSRYASSDGVLEGGSVALLYVAAAGALVFAILLLALARSAQQHSRAGERVVLGILFSVVAIVGCTMAMEVGLRAVHAVGDPIEASRHYFYAHDALLGWRHRPGSMTTFKDALVAINSAGLRDDELGSAGGSAYRILFLGDSQVFGDGVSHAETFVELLQSTLRVDAVNAAVIGYGTDQQLLYYERDGHGIHANLTIVGLNAYDLRDNISAQVRSGYEKPVFGIRNGQLALANVPVSAGSVTDRAQRWLTGSSHLYATVSRLARGSMAREGRDEEDAGSARRAASRLTADTVFPPASQFQRSLETTRLILERLALRVQATGGSFAVLFLPYAMDFDNDPTYRERSDQLVGALRSWGTAGGYGVLDLRRELKSEGARELFLDTMHFSPAGHKAVAHATREWLLSSGFIPAIAIR